MGIVSRVIVPGLIFFLLLRSPAFADSDSRSYHFDIPRQPLGDSLADYSRTIGETVIFKPQVIEEWTAPPLHSELTAREAVDRLLTGTPLVARKTDHGWLIEFVSQEVDIPISVVDSSSNSGQDEILVLGRYSRSLSSADELRRRADYRQDVVLAEDIGKFPALNVAEALKRSPGISVVRDRGEALFLSIRGLPTQFNQFTWNGHPVATNENVRTSEQFGRRFHYDTLPAELVAAVEVKKSTVAAEEADAIGGRVNIRSFKPLDWGRTGATVTTAASYSSLAQATRPRLSALGSWVKDDGSMGLLLAGTYSERKLRQDRALNFRWYQIDDATLSTPPGRSISPGSVRPTLELETRKRRGLSAAWQWKLSGGTRMALNLMHLNQTMDYREFSYSADYDPQRLEPDSLVWRNNALIGGATESGSVQISRESAGILGQLDALDMSFEHDWRDWGLRLDVAASEALSRNPKPIRRTRLRREEDVSLVFRYHPISEAFLPEVDYRRTSLNDPSDFPGRRLEWRIMAASDQYSTLGLTLTRQLAPTGLETLELGLQFSDRSRSYRRRDALFLSGIEGHYFPDDYFSSMPVDNFLSKAGGRLPKTWLIPDESRFWSAIDSEALADGPASERDRLNSYQVKEDISAAYTQLNINGRGLQGNLGVRYAHTDQLSLGHRMQGDGIEAVSFANGYGHLLPAANVALDLSPDLLWRSSASRVINRPDLQDLAPRLTLNSGDRLTAVGGNPQLQPVTAWQYDTALEWYFSDRGLVSLGLFHTDMSGFIQTETREANIGGEIYQLTTRTNGARAEVTGVEVDYHQVLDFLRLPRGTLGIQANATWTDSSAQYRDGGQLLEDELADVAARTTNVSVFYEAPGLDVRLSYNWRSQVLKEVGTFDLEAQNSAPFGSLDGHLSLELGQGRLFLEGINLTGEAEQESVAGGEFAGYTYYGRTLIAGYRWDF